MSVFTRLVVATTHSKPVERLITGTRPGSALAHRFVAGDTLDQAIDVARELNRSDFAISLDLLGEEVHDVASAERACEEYLASMDRIHAEDLDANISVKLTQLGLAIDEELAAASIDVLAQRADAIGHTVTIDMEDSRYTEATVRLYELAQRKHGNLGIALQTCMRRTPDDLARLIPLEGHIRLCKGAYVEHEDVAFVHKSEVDQAFREELRLLMGSEHVKPAIATHDPTLIDLTRRLAGDRDGYFEFQMLYGVSTVLQKELVETGYPVRVYLPFGSQWYPYLTRRLAERPANAWFFVKAALSGRQY